MAKNLAEAKINTTLITECQIGTIMPRVNKVIIGTHSFMANGGQVQRLVPYFFGSVYCICVNHFAII